MKPQSYQYTFEPAVPAEQIKDCLFMAAVAAECLHGRESVRLDASFQFNPADKTCTVRGGNEIGSTIARVFSGFLVQRLGEDAFKVTQTFIGEDNEEDYPKTPYDLFGSYDRLYPDLADQSDRHDTRTPHLRLVPTPSDDSCTAPEGGDNE